MVMKQNVNNDVSMIPPISMGLRIAPIWAAGAPLVRVSIAELVRAPSRYLEVMCSNPVGNFFSSSHPRIRDRWTFFHIS